MSSSSSPRVARKRALAREQILDAARELVRRDGVAGLTIEGVAALADISKPAVYYYFESKDALTRALAISRSRDEVAAVRAAVEGVPAGSSVVDSVIRAYVAHHLESLHLFRAEYVWGQVLGFSGEQVDAEVNPDMIALYDLIERRLSEDRKGGLLHEGLNLRRVAVCVWMAAHGLVATLSLLDAGGTRFLHDVDDVVSELCAALTRGIYRQRPRRRGSAPSSA